ncbi:TPA: hypothetical protein N2G45_002883 [Salmonella enterica]|nr:hypothetical protein [Salmonella enterica]HCL5283978.1 hypothetical protein [Salmonella enterica]
MSEVSLAKFLPISSSFDMYVEINGVKTPIECMPEGFVIEITSQGISLVKRAIMYDELIQDEEELMGEYLDSPLRLWVGDNLLIDTSLKVGLTPEEIENKQKEVSAFIL